MPIEKLRPNKKYTNSDLVIKINELIDKLHKLDTHVHEINISGESNNTVSYPRYIDGSISL